MVFSSLVFLFQFLPLVLVAYCLCPAKYRNFLLLIVSLFFYAWGEPRYILIMLFSTVFDYCNGRALEYLQEHDPNKSKWILVLSMTGNLAILCFFKYTDFLILNFNQLFSTNLALLKVTLPIGISFYTFQTMSYTIDVYRGKVKAQHDFIAFAMYVSMFPQLIAGPIVRYSMVEQDLYHRELQSREMALGMQRFLIGLGKKVLLANQIGALWTEIVSGSHLSMAGAWLGAVAYTFQIYFDFSAYSDMAIGLGRIFGFRFPENFNYPYVSKSVTEFWHRWHISLSSWFREYLYIPLGGNRLGLPRQIVNLFLVWALTGLWHGASWNFVLWGIYYFVILVVEKLYLSKELEQLQDWVRHVYTMFVVTLGWVIFACEDMGAVRRYLAAMFGRGNGLCDETARYQFYTHIILLIILALASTKCPGKCVSYIWDRVLKVKMPVLEKYDEQIGFSVKAVCTLLILLFSLAFLINGSYNPFLYFRF